MNIVVMIFRKIRRKIINNSDNILEPFCEGEALFMKWFNTDLRAGWQFSLRRKHYLPILNYAGVAHNYHLVSDFPVSNAMLFHCSATSG
jgi:hypothetical protein